MKTLLPKNVEILSEETAYKNFFQIKRYRLRHELFAGGWSQVLERELFERNPVAAALPYDPKLDKVVLIEQFRVGALRQKRPWLLEIVAGIAENHETIEEMIRRELQEESGLVATQLHKMYEYWVSPGGSNEYLTMYCAMVDARKADGIHGLKIEHEDILVHVVSSAQAFEMLHEGTINNATSIVALQWLFINKDYIRSLWLK